MHFEIFVEEPSAEAALVNIIPKIVGTNATFGIYPHGGKNDLLSNLPHRLRAYVSWLPNDWRIVVLVDLDARACKELKNELEDMAIGAGLVTKTSVLAGAKFQVLNRIAIEELEAWFWGDIEALVTTYPKVNPHLHAKAKYRDSDAIAGGTWEALERELQRAGYFREGLRKVNAAREISANMDPTRNTSQSFQTFYQGLLAALAN